MIFKNLKIKKNKKAVDKIRLEKLFIKDFCPTCHKTNCSEKVGFGGTPIWIEYDNTCKNWRIKKEITKEVNKYNNRRNK